MRKKFQISNCRFQIVVVAALSAATCAIAALQQPIGFVHLLGGADVVCTDPSWTNPNVDGVRLRLSWSDYEPTEGTYLWNQPSDCAHGNDLDDAIRLAYAAHKFVGVSIQAGADSPDWIFAAPVGTAGVYPFYLDPADPAGEGKTYMPLIWDTIFQTKFRNFINALAAHIATLPGKSAVLYVVTTGVAKGVDMRTWCQNFDASVSTTGGSYTDTGTGSGFCKVHSTTAHFLTHSGQTSGNIVGKSIIDVADASGLLGGNATVCDHNTVGCPADPTDTDVYVVKNTHGNACVVACTNQPVIVFEWLVGLGEDYQMAQLAISPPGGYAGLVGTANPNGWQGTGDGSNGNYLPAVETMISYWFNAFPSNNLILTWSAPCQTAQCTTVARTIQDDMRNVHGIQYGQMVVSLQAQCPPHNWGATTCPPPKGYTCFDVPPHPVQAIYGSASPNIYGNGTCYFKGPSALQDMIDNGFDTADKCLEIYTPDCDSMNPVTGDPAVAAMALYERSRFHFFNPQPQTRAVISMR